MEPHYQDNYIGQDHTSMLQFDHVLKRSTDKRYKIQFALMLYIYALMDILTNPSYSSEPRTAVTGDTELQMEPSHRLNKNNSYAPRLLEPKTCPTSHARAALRRRDRIAARPHTDQFSPRVYRTNLRTLMFSPSEATVSFTRSFTVLLSSLM